MNLILFYAFGWWLIVDQSESLESRILELGSPFFFCLYIFTLFSIYSLSISNLLAQNIVYDVFSCQELYELSGFYVLLEEKVFG